MQGLWTQNNAKMVLAQKVKVLEMAKGNDGEIVSWNEDVRDEALRRNARAGYCERDGTPKGAGKGDRYRSVNKKKYDEGYKRIFGKE